MRVVRYTATAKRDLRNIARYIRDEASPATAKAVINRIRQEVVKLERDGLRYRERPELGPGRRAIPIGP